MCVWCVCVFVPGVCVVLIHVVETVAAESSSSSSEGSRDQPIETRLDRHWPMRVGLEGVAREHF